MMSLWDALRMNMMISYQELVRTFPKAIEFVQDSPLKYQLFIQQYSRVTTESEVVARTIKAVQESTEALALFDTEQTS